MAQYFYTFDDETDVADVWEYETWSPAIGRTLELSYDSTLETNRLKFGSASQGRYFAKLKKAPISNHVEVFSTIFWTGEQNDVYVGGNGTPGNYTAYKLSLERASSTVRISKFVGGSGLSNIASALLPFSTPQGYYKFRFSWNANINELKAKVWEYGAEEPSAWNVETTDTSLGVAGTIGLFTYAAQAEYQYVGIGTDGDPAPTAPLAESHISREFSGDTLNAQPSDFTKYDDISGVWEVVDDGIQKVLRHFQGSSSGSDKELAWDGVGAPNIKYDDVLIKVRPENVGAFDSFPLIMNHTQALQTAGAAVGIAPTMASELRLAGVNTFSQWLYATLPWTLVSNEWIYIRARISPSSTNTSNIIIKVRAWRPVDSEPTTWLIDTEQYRPAFDTNTGFLGMQVWNNTGGYMDWAWISIGKNGWSASNLDDQSVATPINLGTTNLLATSARLTWGQG